MKKAFGIVIGVAVLGVGAMVLADETKMGAITPTQGSLPKPVIGTDTLEFTSNVGSFKVLGSDEAPANGRLELNVNGTVLISGLEGTVSATAMEKEYESKEYGKQAYFGKGKLVVNGEVRSIQVFGRGISGTFKGTAVMRMYREFDKNLETGWVKYKGGDREAWGTSGNVKVVPQQIYNSTQNVKIKDSE